MPPRIDLHVHTNRSDGTFTPSEAVRFAVERGLAGIAITDHDTTEGLEAAGVAAREARIELLNGVEFSAEYEGTSIHVLGYFMDLENAAFQEELTRLRDDRFRRGEKIVEKLQELGYDISFERVREIAAGGNIVRPHIAQAMVEAGIVPSEKEAFTQEFIADGGRASVNKHALDPLNAVDLIVGARGVCVLAHPGMWGAQTSVPDELIEAMTSRGMGGLETDHTDHTPEQREHYRAMAEGLELVWTGGSDCHGTRYDPIRMGSFTTDPDRVESLRERAGGRNGETQ
jgi:predicted metal-dependent phosphoesterase TrpH